MITIVSYASAIFAYGVLALLVVLGGRVKGPSAWLLAACVITAGWAGSVIFSAAYDELRSPSDALLETARSVAWVVLLRRLLLLKVDDPGSLVSRRVLVGALAFVASLVAADAALAFVENPLLQQYDHFARIGLAIAGLALLENLARNDQPSALWAMKFAMTGLGGMFAYDLFLYSEALLFQRIDPELYAARGVVNAMAVPLMVLAFSRNPKWAVEVHVSRQFVFHSFTLIGSGTYLILMGLAGYWLRSFGGSWGTLLQVGFFSAALILVLLTVSSQTFRSLVRRFVSENFFSYKYDYRKEWMRFLRVISAQESFLPLHERAVQAIANIVDSPGGALWMMREREEGEHEGYTNTVAWNVPPIAAPQELGEAVTDYFERTGMPLRIDGRRLERQQAAPAPPDPPAWLAQVPRGWLLVPLIHHESVLGFAVLTASRSPLQLTIEDYELLMMVGRQAASYLAEEESGKALVAARQLESFNRRFAFIVHDIKNLTSQLSLILKNAERHGQNPEFQRDVLATVRNSVARMNTMLEQLGAERRRGANVVPVELGELVAGEWSDARRPSNVEIRLGAERVIVEADPEQVLRVLRHLVQNALDAVEERGTVRLEVEANEHDATVRVIDDGPGMTADFMRDHLFRPFESTKKSGYGIGAFQARQIVRELGGRLEVSSEPGRGTEFRVVLPVRRRQPALSQARSA